MKVRTTALLFVLVLFAACSVLLVQGKPKTKRPDDQPASSTMTEEEKKNIQEYIELLRENLRDEKAELLGSVMQFNPDQSAKFWPIYHDYEAELTKLNDRKVENIKNYARDYKQMTDEKADHLTKEALDFQRERAELLAKYYERVKQSLGATTAARFLRVENQLLFTGSLETDLRADNVLVAPRGIGAQSAGRVAGEGLLTLELTDIVIDGTAHPLVTASYEVRSNGQGGQSTGRIGGGAGLGALVGGIAGGGRGAGMGAAVGAAGGTAASAATTGQQVSIPSESLLEFRLDRPAQLPATR